MKRQQSPIFGRRKYQVKFTLCNSEYKKRFETNKESEKERKRERERERKKERKEKQKHRQKDKIEANKIINWLIC